MLWWIWLNYILLNGSNGAKIDAWPCFKVLIVTYLVFSSWKRGRLLSNHISVGHTLVRLNPKSLCFGPCIPSAFHKKQLIIWNLTDPYSSITKGWKKYCSHPPLLWFKIWDDGHAATLWSQSCNPDQNVYCVFSLNRCKHDRVYDISPRCYRCSESQFQWTSGDLESQNQSG